MGLLKAQKPNAFSLTTLGNCQQALARKGERVADRT